MRTETTAADLVAVVCAVPGVRGIEAGIASTLRTLDARLRGHHADRSRYGLILDPEARTVTVEVALGPSAPVRSVVESIQRAVQEALSAAAPDSAGSWHVLVRVQSIAPRATPAPGTVGV